MDRLDPGLITLHTHSDFSDGNVPLAEMTAALRRAGFTCIGFTDHYADERVATIPGRIGRARLADYIRAARSAGVAAGVEAEILDSGAVAIAPEERQFVDYVIGGIHSLDGIRFFEDQSPIADPGAFAARLRHVLNAAIDSGAVDCIAHPTKLPDAIRDNSGQLLDAAWRRPLIDAAARAGVAFDLNEDSRVPDAAFIADCRRAGVRILIGSDAHTVAEARPLEYVRTVATESALQPDDLFLPSGEA
jgi:histidinol phosphatase-like PHP family hydrolase